MTVLVTGGAGFIGSHLVDRLMKEGENVRVIDNLSSGSKENIGEWLNESNFQFIEGELLQQDDVDRAVKDCNIIFHMAANPEIRIKKAGPEDHFKQNITATYYLLESIRKNNFLGTLIFASSSTVYGEADRIPTTEDYGPLMPISLYGASKLACEALISAYAYMYAFKAVIFRLANVIGSRSNHGVIFDFTQKLRMNPSKLEVLGDGTQTKSYIHVDDCVDGFIHGLENVKPLEIYNLGSDDTVTVLDIANIVKEATGHPDAEIKLSGGVDGGRGWRGDVKVMFLETERLKNTGWSTRYNSLEAVKMTAESVASQNNLLMKGKIR